MGANPFTTIFAIIIEGRKPFQTVAMFLLRFYINRRAKIHNKKRTIIHRLIKFIRIENEVYTKTPRLVLRLPFTTSYLVPGTWYSV